MAEYIIDDRNLFDDVESFYREAKNTVQKKLGGQRVAGYELEDIVQESVIKLLDALKLYDSTKSKLSTYCDRVLNNAIRDILRRAGAEKNLAVVNAIPLETEFNTEDEEGGTVVEIGAEDVGYENFEFVTDIMENLGLNEREKQIFKLRAAGYEFVEIAQILGISKARVSQIYKGMKEKYEQL